MDRRKMQREQVPGAHEPGLRVRDAPPSRRNSEHAKVLVSKAQPVGRLWSERTSIEDRGEQHVLNPATAVCLQTMAEQVYRDHPGGVFQSRRALSGRRVGDDGPDRAKQLVCDTDANDQPGLYLGPVGRSRSPRSRV